MITEPLYTEYTRITNRTIHAVAVKLISMNVVIYPEDKTGIIKCNMRTITEYIELPIVHTLQEEEYFQHSLLIDIDMELLRSIQKHAIEVIESNGDSVNFHDYMHSKKQFLQYEY